jgi:heme/copper-type cytochrome/quinol oxidase subunit 1
MSRGYAADTLEGMIAALRKYGILALGVIGMIVGADIVLFWSQEPMARRWAAYAPLSDTVFVPPFVTGVFVLGFAILIAGTGLVAGWIGFALGRRRRV